MTASEAKILIKRFLANNTDVQVYTDEHPPLVKQDFEFIVVNVPSADYKSWSKGYANINWFVSNITDFTMPDIIRLRDAEKKLISLFNHGKLISQGNEHVYCSISKTELIKDQYSYFVNLELDLQITNFN